MRDPEPRRDLAGYAIGAALFALIALGVLRGVGLIG